VRILLAAGGLLIAVVLGLKVLVLVAEPRLTFLPVATLATTPEAYGLPFEDLHPVTADGLRLRAWLIPAREGAGEEGAATPPASGQPAAGAAPLTLVFFHGNAENIGTCLDLARMTRPAGYNLVLAEYRGYGGSEGSPSERGIYLDGEAVLRSLAGRPGVDPRRIVLWGRSIGGAVAVHLAAGRAAVAGVVLESPFTSARELMREGGTTTFVFYLLSFLSSYRFDLAGKIERVSAPVLIVHGTDDEVVPFALGRRLFERAPGRKEFAAIEGGGHNDLMALHGEELWHDVARFLATLR
jgi:hypothetical protein